ncbi:MAG: S1C family serine protease [Candidatus Limivivens sp.]|nr:S1C family serine protease [Candidatus Limivivens sp.]
MQDKDKQEYTFISEQIRKKPFYRKQWFQRSVITLGLAVLFGGAAGVAFAVVKPWAENLFGTPEEPARIMVPQEPVEDAQEKPELITEIGEQESSGTDSAGEYIDISDYRELYAQMAEVAMDATQSIVTVTGEVSDLDLFREADERSIQCDGLIVAKNSSHIYISTEWETISDAKKIMVSFRDGVTAEAKLQKKDSILGTAVIKVSLDSLPEQTAQDVAVAVLGNTGKIEAGMPVIAAGSPLGYSDSLAFGMITSVISLSVTDGQYGLLTTDMIGSDQGSGVLLNLDGDIIGLIAQRFSGGDNDAMLCGLNINDLQESISDLSNDTTRAFLGLRGRDISDTVSAELDMPAGMFVREVMDGSPAMHAGVQKADILTEIDGEEITNVSDYVLALRKCSPGDVVRLTIQRKSMDKYVSLDIDIALGGR